MSYDITILKIQYLAQLGPCVLGPNGETAILFYTILWSGFCTAIGGVQSFLLKHIALYKILVFLQQKRSGGVMYFI